jgi:tRNA modification GTPase
MITHTRHRKAMENALGHLERYKQNDEVEIICEELRLAVKEIASVTGYIGVEDILDIVFHSFCIGK